MPGRALKNRIRIRACGLLVESGNILLVQIHSPVSDSLVWIPPGGEIEFGESLEACLIREFKEETGLEITVGELGFINELIEPPYHAVEFYYEVQRIGGELRLGNDPEREEDNQLLKDIEWVPKRELEKRDIAPGQLGSFVI